ncbi:ECF transporter S component [Butyricicoccus sp. Marseille-Q5471]|uniref:ECF transporter S component n=1 Tax=Butyricicoccus sp. Marseille-Q5471 TaxID=3039493 RepID=UPI0024BC667E|nr:ECF transporter S component [Butyricicoccus sp. Marseille-Q5471]
MKSTNNRISLYDIVMVGLMAAVVFVVTMFLSIRIPTPTGTTMIKLANAFVLLCGLLLGPVRGGLAAGIGSMFFDLMTPEYVPEAWLTFVRFFLMAWLCGVIAHWAGARAKKFSRNLTACVVAAVFSAVFYMFKGIITLMIGGSGFVPAFIGNVPKLVTSVPNTIIAVVVAMALLPALQKALSHTSFGRKPTQTAEK